MTIPFLETVAQHLVTYLEVGKSMDFLARSASKIIEARKTDSDYSALVSL